MPGIVWIIVNAALVVAAIGGTIAVKRRPAPAPVALEEKAAKGEEAKKPAAGAAANASSGQFVAVNNGLPADASLDDLWRHTLFLPSREEIEVGEGGMTPEEAARAAALAAQKIEFELVGIAQMALPEKEPEPVALLRNKVASGGGRAGARRFAGGQPGRGGAGDNTAPDTPAQPVQLVFRTGETVNGTGYKVKSIDVVNRAVEVERGGEVVKLTINFTSEEANQRRNAVAAMENMRRQQAAAEAARAQAQAQSQPQQQPQPVPQPVPQPGFRNTAGNNQMPVSRTGAQPGVGNVNVNVNNRQNPQGVSSGQPPAGPPGSTSGAAPSVGGRTYNRSGGNAMNPDERAERIRRAMEARQRAVRQTGGQ